TAWGQMAAVTVAGKTPTPRFIYDCVAPPHICILTPGAEMREEEKEHLEEREGTWSLTLVIGDFNCQQQHHTEREGGKGFRLPLSVSLSPLCPLLPSRDLPLCHPALPQLSRPALAGLRHNATLGRRLRPTER
ncbi:hypothetical protein KUCAC02_033814, partial [Chaenocephalus aceratus]